jgi:hypothetical protein
MRQLHVGRQSTLGQRHRLAHIEQPPGYVAYEHRDDRNKLLMKVAADASVANDGTDVLAHDSQGSRQAPLLKREGRRV